jgi:hypothetical protein
MSWLISATMFLDANQPMIRRAVREQWRQINSMLKQEDKRGSGIISEEQVSLHYQSTAACCRESDAACLANSSTTCCSAAISSLRTDTWNSSYIELIQTVMDRSRTKSSSNTSAREVPKTRMYCPRWVALPIADLAPSRIHSDSSHAAVPVAHRFAT